MKARIEVVFSMVLDPEGESKTNVKFKLIDYPDMNCPDSVQRLVLQEIKMLCGAMEAAGDQLFKEGGAK